MFSTNFQLVAEDKWIFATTCKEWQHIVHTGLPFSSAEGFSCEFFNQIETY